MGDNLMVLALDQIKHCIRVSIRLAKCDSSRFLLIRKPLLGRVGF